MTLLYAAIALFAAAALLGGVLLTYVLLGKPTPKGVALIHGSLAALGIAVLVAVWATAPSAPLLPLILFVLVAAGGAILFHRDLTRGRVPKSLALGHGLLALAALALLIRFVAVSGA